jgi:hypothetical protein
MGRQQQPQARSWYAWLIRGPGASPDTVLSATSAGIGQSARPNAGGTAPNSKIPNRAQFAIKLLSGRDKLLGQHQA